MKIRSLTYFCNPHFPLDARILRGAGDFLKLAATAYAAAGYEVQTTRLATVPFARMLPEKRLNELPNVAQQLDLVIPQIGIGYAALGPALPEIRRSYEVIPEGIASSRNIYFGGVMADAARGLDLAAVRLCARIIAKCASIEPNGFANLRFAALANVKPGSPFLPAAYHDSEQPAFAIATEAADLAVDAFANARTVDEGRAALIVSIERHAKILSKIAAELTAPPRRARLSGSSAASTRPGEPAAGSRPAPDFIGIDFSLASFPAEAASLGSAFEKLGVARAGLHGSLAAAAILTECLDRARFPRTGFNGLMLPVLEDATLGQRSAEGILTVKDLLLYSAVCGTGVDTVPLPGATTAQQIAPLLLDLSALALRLNKPLTGRLMPVPGKKAGDATGFDFAYFANSKVMSLESEMLHGVLNGDETFQLKPRQGSAT